MRKLKARNQKLTVAMFLVVLAAALAVWAASAFQEQQLFQAGAAAVGLLAAAGFALIYLRPDSTNNTDKGSARLTRAAEGDDDGCQFLDSGHHTFGTGWDPSDWDQSTPVMVWGTDVEGRLAFWNRHWANFCGHGPDGEEALDWRRGIHPEDQLLFRNTYYEAAAHRRSFSAEIRLRRADGHFRWVQITGIPQSSQHEKFVGYIGSAVDITERKRAEETLRLAKETAEVANRTKGQFLANMSHELRTPLNAIIGFSEIMKNELFGPIGHPSYQEYAIDIHESGNHLLNLINDILDVSKAEAGKIVLREEFIDARDVIESSIRLVRARAETGDVAINMRASRSLPRLFADECRIKQILLNLLSNAIKFTPPGGVICAEADITQDGGFSICVVDSGIGISADDIPQVLAPFGQVDSAQNGEIEGTGLGLPLTKLLVELHDGRLELESTEGVGSSVSLIFPPRRVDADGQINNLLESDDPHFSPQRRVAGF